MSWLTSIAGPVAGPNRLLDVADFRSELDRERARSDRGGESFSIVAVSLIPSHGPRRDRAARLLAGRLRTTDVAGVLPDGRIGLLLPGTENQGAWRLAFDLTNECSQLRVQAAFEVWSYPDGESHPHASPSVDATVPVGSVFARGVPWWKRACDIVGAGLGLVLLSPVFAAAAIAIKCSSPGPIFFRQQRTGLGGRPFTIWKFRTMCDNAEQQQAALLAKNEQDGPAFKIEDDPRVTRVGRFLRRTCIDELPQLWNVLVGEMTLVGPRPLPCHESDQCQGWERRRLDVTPGLTCIWQAGARRVSFGDWMRMDLRYIQQRSLTNDLKLLWKTFWKVVMQRASH